MDSQWRASAPIEMLRRRSALLRQVRDFFERRGLLEVETPMLSAAGVTDPNLDSLTTRYNGPGAPASGTLYLHTSPEFPMKRLLAAGSGPIWQVCRVFRGGERGRRHNPEFTMLEWYRPGWDHHRLMEEVTELIAAVAGTRSCRTRTYGELFAPLGIDPHTADERQCRAVAHAHGLSVPEGLNRDGLLDFLFSHLLSPELGRECIDFVHAFPASQASLARLEQGQPPTAARFECFLDGMEIANGFHELCDVEEQRARFEADLAFRGQQGLAMPPMDERLLRALEAGLPDCAGVALGLDRLFMVALGARHIDEVLAFPLDRA